MRVKATLTLTVVYDDIEDPKHAFDTLHSLVDLAADRGYLSNDDLPFVVETFNADVEVETLPDTKEEA